MPFERAKQVPFAELIERAASAYKRKTSAVRGLQPGPWYSRAT